MPYVLNVYIKQVFKLDSELENECMTSSRKIQYMKWIKMAYIKAWIGGKIMNRS